MSDDLWYGTSGPHDAEIVLVGEAWGAEEAVVQRPFVGQSGRLLDHILAEAKLERKDMFVTNTIAARPLNNEMHRFFIPRDVYDPGVHGPKVKGLTPTAPVVHGVATLKEQLKRHPRKVVIATGNYALWALTSVTGAAIAYEKDGRPIPKELQTWAPNGIMNWRGSMWHDDTYGIPLLPIIHPAAIMRQWELRAPTLHDLKARVPMALRGDWRQNPAPVFWAPPTFEQAMSRLAFWLRRAQAGAQIPLACDIETSKGLITCIGFSDSVNFAMCIPWVRKTPTGLDSFWRPEQEVLLVGLLRELLSNTNIKIIGQNFLYDTQYIQHWWGVTPKCDFDTMLAQHLLWPGTPKGLDYISSLYCNYHWYWKDDGKEWDTKGTLEQLLLYNCIDCVRTIESAQVLQQLIVRLNQSKQWEETRSRQSLALRMMNRGVLIDKDRKSRLSRELAELIYAIDTRLLHMVPQMLLPPAKTKPKKGCPPITWITSPKQQQTVFGELLGMRIPKSRKTGNATLGKEAIPELKKRHPEYTNLFELLEQRRSVGVFKSHFADAKLDPDGRMRCYYNPAGTETFRWNSAANAFGRGTNLQNLPSGDEE